MRFTLMIATTLFFVNPMNLAEPKSNQPNISQGRGTDLPKVIED